MRFELTQGFPHYHLKVACIPFHHGRMRNNNDTKITTENQCKTHIFIKNKKVLIAQHLIVIYYSTAIMYE